MAMRAQRPSNRFIETLTPVDVIGFIGLVIAAFIGISLSRFQETS